MCGILVLVTKTFVRHPLPSNAWELRTPEEIQSLTNRPLAFSQADLNKLKSQDILRDLNLQLIKLGNNVKTDNLEKIQQIKQQIKDIIGNDDKIPRVFKTATDEFEFLIPYIANRGPDYMRYNHRKHNNWTFQLFSSILSLRQPFTSQPLIKGPYILQFNGELYEQQCEFSNDTEYLMDVIIKNGIDVLSTINGEFAFVLIDTENSKIYFGRDMFGKRSLCFKLTNELIISSVGLPGYEECKGYTIYEMDLAKFELITHYKPLEYQPLDVLYLGDDHEAKVVDIYRRLKVSCGIRQDTIFPLTSTEADFGVLFSGGIDCTLITAFLLENCMELQQHVTIDLLTVGFDNPRTQLAASNSPDRKLSVKSWFHLTRKFPGIKLRLIEINVDYESWLLHKPVVQDLMYPRNTEMDLSIAIAFYFASNNILPAQKIELTDFDVSWNDFVRNTSAYTTSTEYMSRAKVLFSGLGADELFGGYSRHESLFTGLTSECDASDAYKQLNALLIHDINIIHERNLGRDDRVIGVWGKELRYPYLDVNFVKYVINNIEGNLKIKMNWTTNKKGDVIANPIRKWILRKVAEYMGLDFIKDELKRAIQFGSKSAKMEIGQAKVKGTDAS